MKIKVPLRGGDQRRNGGGVGVEGGGGGAVPPSNLQQVACLCRLPCHHREVCEGEPHKPEFSVAEKELRISLAGIVSAPPGRPWAVRRVLRLVASVCLFFFCHLSSVRGLA